MERKFTFILLQMTGWVLAVVATVLWFIVMAGANSAGIDLHWSLHFAFLCFISVGVVLGWYTELFYWGDSWYVPEAMGEPDNEPPWWRQHEAELPELRQPVQRTQDRQLGQSGRGAQDTGHLRSLHTKTGKHGEQQHGKVNQPTTAKRTRTAVSAPAYGPRGRDQTGLVTRDNGRQTGGAPDQRAYGKHTVGHGNKAHDGAGRRVVSGVHERVEVGSGYVPHGTVDLLPEPGKPKDGWVSDLLRRASAAERDEEATLVEDMEHAMAEMLDAELQISQIGDSSQVAVPTRPANSEPATVNLAAETVQTPATPAARTVPQRTSILQLMEARTGGS